MTFYRKYRPQTLDEVIGQEAVKKVLTAAILANKLSHAYLFTGPRGCGKTSTARILAKIVNCQAEVKLDPDKPLPVPCNNCAYCTSITDGTNLDVIEMDAASNRGIEDIRSLRETIKLATSSAKKKVYIIDEIHMLTGEAFNALLKTLEEPPSHVMFILATTDPQKIPQTILSRVQRLDFKLATPTELMEALKNIVKKEDMRVSDEALLALSKKAQGSFRDGEKLLDQISGYDEIGLDLVEKVFAASTQESQLKLLGNIAAKNSNQALQTLLEMENIGVNLKELNLSLQDLLRQVLLVKNGLGEVVVKREVRDGEYQKLQTLSDQFALGDLLRTIECFQTSIEQARFALIPSLPLELAVVESCLGKLIQTGATEVVEVKKVVVKTPEVSEFRDDIIEQDQPVETPAEGNREDIQKLNDKWLYVLETVKEFNFSLEALLRSAKISAVEGSSVVLEVPYPFHQRILEAPKSKEPLEGVLSDILGRNIKVSTVLGKRKLNKEDVQNIEVAQDDEIVRLAAEIFSSESIN